MSYTIFHADAFEWLAGCEPRSIEAVVTDPPFGVREFDPDHLAKKRSGSGGTWRIPQTTGGANRQAVPRFSTVTAAESEQVALYFEAIGALVHRVLVPGGHLIIATTPLLSDLMYGGLRRAGLEKRSEIVRIVKTIRETEATWLHGLACLQYGKACSDDRTDIEAWYVQLRPTASGRLTVRHWARCRIR